MIANKTTVTARAKCWRSNSGQLVADGDESAIALFARAGQIVPRKDAEKFSNAADFFTGFDQADAPEPEPEGKHKKHK